MALNVVRKGDFETSQFSGHFLEWQRSPRSRNRAACTRRACEVSPQRFTLEVGDVQIIPRRLALLADERLLGIIALHKKRPITAFHDEALRFEDEPFVLSGEVSDEPLLPGVDSHDHVFQVVSL